MDTRPAGLDAPPSATLGLEPPRLDLAALPPRVVRELRASHVGETVAVQLYRGVIAGTGDPAVRRFAESHLAVEERHRRLFDAVLPPDRCSRIMGFWRLSGRLMGWLPARSGSSAVYAVVAAVEHWVDGHYARQVEVVRRLAPDPALMALLAACRADEAAHAADAGRLEPRPRAWDRVLAWLAVVSSRVGVRVARWV